MRNGWIRKDGDGWGRIVERPILWTHSGCRDVDLELEFPRTPDMIPIRMSVRFVTAVFALLVSLTLVTGLVWMARRSTTGADPSEHAVQIDLAERKDARSWPSGRQTVVDSEGPICGSRSGTTAESGSPRTRRNGATPCARARYQPIELPD